jgi:hypothetical protein
MSTALPPPANASGSSALKSSLSTRFLDGPLFTAWSDPITGVTSHILTPDAHGTVPEHPQRIAPLQQSFYFLSPGITDDGRYLWFYCAFPPSGSDYHGRTLAVADLHHGTVRHFPDTQFLEASPLVDRRTGDVYWCTPAGIWTRSPRSGCSTPPRLVNRFDPAFVQHRDVKRYATHLTFSADGKSLNIDAEIGHDFYIGVAPLDGSPIRIWQQMERCYKHGQFSPVDPELMLIAQDFYVDRREWRLHYIENRLWLIRPGTPAAPVYHGEPPAGYLGIRNDTFAHADHVVRRMSAPWSMHSHEWWSADGGYIWYVHHGSGRGVERVSTVQALAGGAVPELVWAHDTVSHAHGDAAGRHLVCDSLPPQDPADRRVTFFDIRNRSELNIVSRMPEATELERRYHIHPHPHFCLGDTLICYTTTVLGRIDVAFTRVSDLKAIMASPSKPAHSS